MGVENYILWSEIVSGFEELGGTPPLRISWSTPPPPPPVEAWSLNIVLQIISSWTNFFQYSKDLLSRDDTELI